MSLRLRALSVHLLTASGAVFAMLALLAAANHDWPVMFLWLVVAFFVVCSDPDHIFICDVFLRWRDEDRGLFVSRIPGVLEHGRNRFFWPDAPRLGHSECHNGFGDCDVFANQIHPSNTHKTLAGGLAADGCVLDDLCRMGRMGVI